MGPAREAGVPEEQGDGPHTQGTRGGWASTWEVRSVQSIKVSYYQHSPSTEL